MTDMTIFPRKTGSRGPTQLRWLTAGMLAWAALVVTLAVRGTFDVPPNAPALPTVAAMATPVLLFAAAMIAAPNLRARAMALVPVLPTHFQAWRILGGLFLAVYAFGHLPGFFAWPAGLGDVAVGIAAAFVALTLSRNGDILHRGGFRTFHFLGLSNFVIAFATGLAARNAISGFVTGVTTAPMGQIPLVLIPAFVVPAFIILHLIVLMQSYARR